MTTRRKPGSQQPKCDPKLQLMLATEVEIDGVKAFTLFDSGSTTDSITPEFSYVSKVKQFTLEEQVVLQLRCASSWLKISYGTEVPVNFGGFTGPTYFNIVNLDKYDCILSTIHAYAWGDP